MSIVPILSTDTIVPIGRAETSVRQLKAEHDSVPVMNASDSNSPTSPPVTPPTKSSNQDTDTVKRSSLPSPPPSSRRSRAPDHHHHHHHHDQDHDQDQDQDRDQRDDLQEHEGIEKIARRLSATARPSSGAGIMTHSSSSSTSSSASHHSTIPSTLNNKHITQLKTKTLGHLTRSTSSEVDNEVANALASGRSIVSKTDWKEEDAQYLVQLIENRFPKGNIIWDWVGQQMTNRGFTKSQCRSKWKRIRTKVLHGNDPPNKDRDSRDNVREQEPDELIEDDEDELQESKHGHPRWRHSSASLQHHQRQDHGRSSVVADSPHHYRAEHHRSFSSQSAYDQHSGSNGYYYERSMERHDGYRSRESPAPSVPPVQPHNRPSMSFSSHRTPTRRSPPVEEDELWSDEDQAGNRPDHGMSARGHQDYTDREHSQSHHSSPRQPQHHRRQLSSSQIPDDLADDPMRSTLSIAATPTSFGKIEWKPEDSDYLVHLIESKFSSRKVDWAWVSKRMEGRGYDRTQCKSRWWRVQHRQNQSGQYGSISQPLSSRGRQPSGSDPLPRTEFDANESANDRDDKSILSDAGEADPHRKQGSSERITRSPSTSRDPGTLQRDEPRAVHSHHRYSKSKDRGEMEENPGVDDQGSSPRTARPHEHQKHIEWKEEDSQYMYRMIEREFPVGNVVWSVIGEKMASRGYSQTQCMSKWRRHLKNNKLSGENNKGSASMDMDIDVDMGGTPNPNGVHIDNGPRTTVATAAAYRRRGEDERSIYGADRGEGAKRLKTHGPDNRSHERDFSRSGAPLDPRLVEMEYDRYYDAGGKRRRAGGDGYQASDHPSRHGRTISSSSFDDYRGYVRDPSKYYPGEGEAGVTGSRHRRDYSMNEDVPAVVPNSDRDARTSRSETSYGPYGDSAPHQRRHPHASTQGPYESDYIQKDRRGEDNAMAMDEEWDEPPKSIREPRSAKRYHAQAPLSSEPHGWSEEQRRGGTRAEGSHTHTAHHHSHHQNHNHHRSSSSASVAYRDQYDQPQSYADTPGVSGRYKDSNEQSHHYARAGEPMPDPSREGRRRPHEPEPEPMREQRDRPMARSPDRGFVGNTSSARYRARPGMDREDGLAEDDYTNRGHMNRSSMDFDRDGGPRYNYRSSRYDRPTSRSYPSRRPPAEEDQDLEFIDYALEDDMDWASGRFESRDMARLAAAVARQGRRWDALRAQIRIPILMNPYEDDDIYDGMRFDPHPSTYAYSPGGSKGSSQQYSHRRRSSSLAGRHQRHVSGTTSTRYGPPPTRNGAAQITSTGPASLPVERSAHAASKSAQFERSRRVVPESTLPVLSEPVEVDLVMETPEGSGSMHTQQSVASGRVSRGAEEEAIVDVVSVDVEEGVRPDGEPTKVVHDDRLEEIEQGQDQVMAEADPVADEGEQRTEAMEREHGEVEAGPSEQQVEALDVQEGGAAVAAGAEEAARGIQTMSSA